MKARMIILALMILVLISSKGFSQDLMDVGNKFCPVSGDKVSGKTFVEYNGQKIGTCCKMCLDKFNKNPEKYLANLEAELSSGTAEDADHLDGTGMMYDQMGSMDTDEAEAGMEMHEDHHHE